MTGIEALAAFTVTAGLITLTPGLDTALVLRTAAVEGGRRALCAGLGVAAGCLAWGLAVALGLGAVLAASELAYTVLRWTGAAYVVWLGIRLIRGAGAGPDVQDAVTGPHTGAPGWFLRGLTTNLLNPKVGVFYVTFLPQFVPAGADVVVFSTLLATVHAVEGIAWFTLLVAATRPLTAALRRPRVTRVLDTVTGGVLLAFGLRLVTGSPRA
ncbi:LysE family translocator [Arhodomonas sp. KWT2]|uniref:LysE family translocator n=1 Tax=unclassified Arhodomonas TaxID=2621637 RepID=UPI0013D7CD4D|nr:LysE family translocator [Arhodomonas sp. KWT]